MHPALAKTPAYKYAKEFSISNALANLQAYKLATNQVNAGDISQVQRKHGQDEGALFGELITMASGKETVKHCRETGDDEQSFKRRRRRKRKKINDCPSSDDNSSDQVGGTVTMAANRKQVKGTQAKKRPVVNSLVAVGYGSPSETDSDDQLSEQCELLPAPENIFGTTRQSAFENRSYTESDSNHSQPVALRDSEEKSGSSEDDCKDFFGMNSSSEDDGEDTIFLGCKAYQVRPEDVRKSQAQEEAERQKSLSKLQASDAPYISTVMLTSDQVPEESRLDLPENRLAVWDFKNHKWKNRASSLTTYKCWKCNRVGHFPEDCVSTMNMAAAHPALPGVFTQEKMPGQQVYSKLLRDYYGKCRRLQQRKDVSCTDCGAHSNLCHCLDCGMTLCDGRGHLADHLLRYTSHNKLYSFKLRRQLKCCKPTCEVMDVTELLACSSCLSTIFDRHYSMVNATWSGSGLKAVANTLCCEDHFHWHRVNCMSSINDRPFSRENLESHRRSGGLISEFFL